MRRRGAGADWVQGNLLVTGVSPKPDATGEQLVRQLQDWCQRAEASGIAPLADFSRRLRSYA